MAQGPSRQRCRPALKMQEEYGENGAGFATGPHMKRLGGKM